MLRIRDVYPRSWYSSFPDSESWILNRGSNKNKKRGGGKILFPTFLTFFVTINFKKLKIILFKLGGISPVRYSIWFFQPVDKFKYFLPINLLLSSQKYGLGIRDLEKLIPENRIRGSKKHRIPDPQHQILLGSGLCVLFNPLSIACQKKFF